MDARTLDACTERAEFYLCVARAFMTPRGPDAFFALRDALADDLADLGDSLGYAFAADLSDYRRAIEAVGDAASLLGLYSRLFVAPPRIVQINTGTYLDGAVNGGSVAAMEAAYRRCGVERGSGFHDLSDHVSVQLEFVALLYFRKAEAARTGAAAPDIAPEHFLGDFAAHWLPPFIRDLERAQDRRDLANPYLPLARVLAAAVLHEAVPEPVPASEQRARNAIGKARHERAVRGVTAEDMEFIARKLREKGLATDHLAIAPERRDEARGFTRKPLPSPRAGSRFG